MSISKKISRTRKFPLIKRQFLYNHPVQTSFKAALIAVVSFFFIFSLYVHIYHANFG